MNSPLDNPDQDLTNQSEPLKVWMALLHNASYLQNICLTKFTWDKKRVCLCVYWVSKEFIRLLCKNKRHFLFSTLTCSLVLQRLLADYQITNDCKYKLLHLCDKEHIFMCSYTFGAHDCLTLRTLGFAACTSASAYNIFYLKNLMVCFYQKKKRGSLVHLFIYTVYNHQKLSTVVTSYVILSMCSSSL